MIYKVKLELGMGGGIQEEYIQAHSAEEALKLEKEYLDWDCWGRWPILSQSIEEVETLPEGWPVSTPNTYGVYRG